MALSPGILHGIEIKVSLNRPDQSISYPFNSRMRTLDPSEVTVKPVVEPLPAALSASPGE